MSEQSKCPDELSLASYMDGSGKNRDDLTRHLEICPRCRELASGKNEPEDIPPEVLSRIRNYVTAEPEPSVFSRFFEPAFSYAMAL